MKKILLSTAVAVVLVAALAVTAFAVGVSGPSSVATGDKIDITVTGSEQGTSGRVSVSGLRVDSVSGDLSSPSDFLVLADGPGGLTATYSCTVTAEAGETASFSVSNVVVSNGEYDFAAADGSWSARVPAAEPTQEPSSEPTTEPSDEPTTQPSGEPSATTSASAEPSGSATVSPSSSASSSASVKPGGAGQTSAKPSSGKPAKTDKMPKTGDTTMDLWTLLVVAGACAAVAVVAGKKVFSAK